MAFLLKPGSALAGRLPAALLLLALAASDARAEDPWEYENPPSMRLRAGRPGDDIHARPDALRQGFGFLLDVFRDVLSPIDGPKCPHYPTCSQFAREAVNRYGPGWGVLMTASRLTREYPGILESGHFRLIRVGALRAWDPPEDNWLFGEEPRETAVPRDAEGMLLAQASPMPPSARPQTDPDIPSAAGETVERRMALGEALLAREEWYRAATLFMEAALLATGPTALRAWLRAGDAHAGARQWDTAILSYQEAVDGAGLLSELAALRIGEAHYLAGRYALAAEALTPRRPGIHAGIAAERDLYRALALLHTARYSDAAAIFGGIAADESLAPETRTILTELAEKAGQGGDIPRRSRSAAALLSAVLPGAGQAYTGHWGEAAASLGVNALFGLLTWDAWLKGRDLASRPHRGWAYTTTALYATIGSSFYLGNVYGAAVSADRFNARRLGRFRQSLEDATLRLPLLEWSLEE